MPRQRNRKGPMADINVVPYIDVMLVLLVIFMITAPLLTQGINVELPRASAKALPPQNDLPLIISVDTAGHYYLNVNAEPKLPISARQLMTQVAARLQLAHEQHKKLAVYVKGDRFVNYGKVVSAMALLQKAGAHSVGLITQDKQSPVNR